jgi:hypothetical protein
MEHPNPEKVLCKKKNPMCSGFSKHEVFYIEHLLEWARNPLKTDTFLGVRTKYIKRQ